MTDESDAQNRSRVILTLHESGSEIDGVDVINLRKPERTARPKPGFLYGPVPPDSLRHFHNDHYQPPVSVFLLRDVEVLGPWFITGSLLIRGDAAFHCVGIALDPQQDESRKRLSEHAVAIKTNERSARHIPGQVLLLANNGHQIYGHWLVDFLPKLYLLEMSGIDIDDVNIVLPSNMGEFGGGFLRLLGVREDRIVQYDPDRETIIPETLIVPTTLRWGGRCSPLFAEAVAFINQLIDRTNRVPDSSHRKIFLSRADASSRRLVNKARVEAMAIAAGFALVEPERLSLLEQIGLFRNATGVLGQYGSALHATIFSPPNVVVGGLHGPLPATFDALQSGIGERLDQPTGYVFASSPSPRDDPWAIEVNEQDLDACLATEFSG